MTQNNYKKIKITSDIISLKKYSKISKALLYAGIFVLISTFLIYLILSKSESEMVISFWLISMLGGVLLIFLSQFVEWKRNNYQR